MKAEIHFSIDPNLLADAINLGTGGFDKKELLRGDIIFNPESPKAPESLVLLSLSKKEVILRRASQDIVVERRLPARGLVSIPQPCSFCFNGYELRHYAPAFKDEKRMVCASYCPKDGSESESTDTDEHVNGELHLRMEDAQRTTDYSIRTYPIELCSMRSFSITKEIGLTTSVGSLKAALDQLALLGFGAGGMIDIHCSSGLVYVASASHDRSAVVELLPHQASGPKEPVTLCPKASELLAALGVFHDDETIAWSVTEDGQRILLSAKHAKCEFITRQYLPPCDLLPLLRAEFPPGVTVDGSALFKVLTLFHRACTDKITIRLNSRKQLLELSAKSEHGKEATEEIKPSSWRLGKEDAGLKVSVDSATPYQVTKLLRRQDVDLSFGKKSLRIRPTKNPQHTYFLRYTAPEK